MDFIALLHTCQNQSTLSLVTFMLCEEKMREKTPIFLIFDGLKRVKSNTILQISDKRITVVKSGA